MFSSFYVSKQNFDFLTFLFYYSGTGHEVWGNCNAPKAITLSALIYCLRCMVGHDVPLNQVRANNKKLRVVIIKACHNMKDDKKGWDGRKGKKNSWLYNTLTKLFKGFRRMRLFLFITGNKMMVCHNAEDCWKIMREIFSFSWLSVWYWTGYSRSDLLLKKSPGHTWIQETDIAGDRWVNKNLNITKIFLMNWNFRNCKAKLLYYSCYINFILSLTIKSLLY